jgi:hypothetical protein
VIGKLVDANVDPSRVRDLLNTAGVTIEPLWLKTLSSPERCVPSTAAVRYRSEIAVASPSPSGAIPPRSSRPTEPGRPSTYQSTSS